MALTYRSFEDYAAQARAELRRRNPAIDPTVFGSFSRPFLESSSALAWSNTQIIRDLERQLFPQTAQGAFLELLAGYEGLSRLSPSSSSGIAIATGTLGTLINSGTTLNASGGLVFTSQSVSSISNQSQVISSLTRSGTTVTGTTATAHNLANGLSLTISGAAETEYNGTFDIVATSPTQFTYTITGSPTTPATGSISYAGVFALVNVTCTTSGSNTNLNSGASLALSTAISGVDISLTVNVDGLRGGADRETDDALRQRVLLSRSTLEGVFTPNQIELAGLSVAGNTRVFVIRPSLSVCDPNAGNPGMIPAPGQTAVYVIRDNDDNIVPSQAILDRTKQAIITEGSLPGNTAESDLFVLGPALVTVDFTFTALSPDTPTMRTAVQNQLRAFFEDRVRFQTNVLEAQYLGEIDQTQDTQTGQRIASFTLSAPSGDVAVSNGQLAVLGTVTFNV